MFQKNAEITDWKNVRNANWEPTRSTLTGDVIKTKQKGKKVGRNRKRIFLLKESYFRDVKKQNNFLEWLRGIISHSAQFNVVVFITLGQQ